MTIKVYGGKYEIRPSSRHWALYTKREWGLDRSLHKNLREVCSEIIDSEISGSQDYKDIWDLKLRIEELERKLTVEAGAIKLLGQACASDEHSVMGYVQFWPIVANGETIEWDPGYSVDQPPSAEDYLVYVDWVLQSPGDDYTVTDDGHILFIGDPPAKGATITGGVFVGC